MAVAKADLNGHAEDARSEVLLLSKCKNAAGPAVDHHRALDFGAIWSSVG